MNSYNIIPKNTMSEKSDSPTEEYIEYDVKEFGKTNAS